MKKSNKELSIQKEKGDQKIIGQFLKWCIILKKFNN